MEKLLCFFYTLVAVLFISMPQASSQAASLSCVALKNVVVRSLFPMMVLTRLIASSPSMHSLAHVLSKSRIWKRLSLSDALLPTVLSGLISGIPSGAHGLQEMLSDKKINMGEAKKALALCSLPSPAFVILVASRSVGQGVMRYIIMVVSAYVTALLFDSEKSNSQSPSHAMSFSKALSSAVTSALVVSGSIVFFTALASLAGQLFPTARMWSAVFLELGSGAILSGGNEFAMSIALGWSGISSLCQLRSEAPSIPVTAYITARVLTVASLVILFFTI